MDDFTEIMVALQSIEEDTAVPKNIRIKVKNTIFILSDEEINNSGLKVDKSLQELSDLAEDPNLAAHTRMQIWSIVSQLESK